MISQVIMKEDGWTMKSGRNGANKLQ